MENWENRLSEKLKNRQKRDRTSETFLKVQNEIIRPTLEKIKSMLYEYHINSSLGLNDSSLSVEAIDSSFILLRLEFEVKGNDEIIARTTYFDLNPIGRNEIKNSEDNLILLSEITDKLIGELFVNSFEKTKFFDK